MNYKKLAASLTLPQLAGALGAAFTSPAIPNWYANLAKPSFSPPNWIFGPAWITLYLLMGISIYLIWSSYSSAPSEDKKTAFWLFWIHLFFNAIWSVIFFGLQNPLFALIDIAIIWLLIIVLIVKFWKISKWSAYLLIPYLLWVSFASVLNYFIWYLN